MLSAIDIACIAATCPVIQTSSSPLAEKAIFIHGCFWHQHDCRLGAKQPRARPEYWLPKLQGNKERDVRNLNALRAAGWEALVIWECELSDVKALERPLRKFLG
jgi:DNA mismatch endonuclease (patch repair protein)